MINYEISRSNLVYTASTSKGTQVKYYKDNYWYKCNSLGYENYAEVLCSLILECSTLQNYVTYELCKVNGRPACRSKNFLAKDETFISFQRLYEMVYGADLSSKVLQFSSVEQKIEFTLDFLMSITKLDLKQYLNNILAFDLLCLNEDRHFNNLGVVYCADGTYREAHIFDNGLSLLSDYSKYPAEECLEQAIKRCVSRPFSGGFISQVKIKNIGFSIDFDLLKRRMNTLLEQEGIARIRAFDVLDLQIQRYGDLFKPLPSLNCF